MLKSIAALMIVAVSHLAGTSAVAGESPADDNGPQTYETARELAQKTPGVKNLRDIVLAMHGYADVFKRFPPAVLKSPKGELYSWRVEILPVLKHYVRKIEPQKLNGNITREVYNQLIADCGYDINAPWDSPQNAKVLEEMSEFYRHPLDAAESTLSGFYAVVGTGTAFDPDENTPFDRAWMSTTLMVVESRNREPWTKPVDITYSPTGTVPRFGGFTENGFLAATCDGAVHFVPDATSPDTLRAFLSKTQDDTFKIVGIPYRYK